MNVPISFRNLHNQKTALFQFERCLGEPLIFFFVQNRCEGPQPSGPYGF